MKSLLKIGLAFIGLVLLVLLIVTYAPKTTDEPVGGAVVAKPAQTKEQKFDAILSTSKMNTEVSKMDRKEFVELKAYAIKKAVKIGKFDNAPKTTLLGAVTDTYEVEITQVDIIDGGVQVFARAWKNGTQLGFGKDGTVDIERFIIKNPPVLVDDPLGDVVRSGGFDSITSEPLPDIILREDPEEALRKVIIHTVSIVGKGGAEIVKDTIGHTTSVLYGSAGSVEPFDGSMFSSGAVYNTINQATDSSSSNTTDTYRNIQNVKDGSTYYINRLMFGFDITGLGTISAVTLSLAGNGTASNNANLTNGSVVSASPASTSGIANGDWDSFGTTVYSSIVIESFVTTAGTYNDFGLDATGISYVAGWSTVGFLGFRIGTDISNTAPTGYNSLYVRMADYTGTANDPTLTVVHSPAVTVQPLASDLIDFQ